MANLIHTLTIQETTNKPQKNNNKKVAAASIAGSAIGIATAVAGVYSMAKKGNPALTLKNLAYEEKDVLLVGAGSVIGGLAGGLIADKNEKNIKPKVREASQQFFGNMVFPLGFLAIGNKILDKLNIQMPQIKASNAFAKYLNPAIAAIPKAVTTIAALVGGMEIGNKIMNEVNNKIFKEKVKHDVHAEDYLVHADDICLTANMVLKEIPNISSVTSKILPLTFIVSGSKTGMQKQEA